MRVVITDEDDNWRRWGALLLTWVHNPACRPNTTGELLAQFKTNGIDGKVPGPNRPVQFIGYDEGGTNTPLTIALPNKAMLDAKLATIPVGIYPIPKFYDLVYGGAPRVSFTEAERDAFELRRIGEYTINECC
jgi:hypothetical protein